MLQQILEKQNALGLLAAALAHGEQVRQASPGGAVLRIGENVGRAVGKAEPRADDELEGRQLGIRHRVAQMLVELFERAVGAHHAGNAVAVRDSHAGKAQRHGLAHQILRMRCAAQKGKMGGDGKLRIGGRRGLCRRCAFGFLERDDNIHANTPCRNQRVGSPLRTRPSR